MTTAKSIAIVDDDRLIRSSAASLMRSFGIAASTFESAEAFLAADAKEFACIISDVQMGGMSGLDLQDELNRRRISTPLILITAYPTDRLKDRALAGGARYFLEKPWSVDDLLVCLEEIMGPLS
ncbi:response regulator transcription factor [Sphingomonas oleivorans]|uniref:response regulator transcription factor n=1 Tax=Sphingomonas oleivorans TaxID=1735121 RepID=UPI0013FD66A3|nr:response regulator [Sphingomonas oleivorans]